jgi:hypothetical protein
MMPKEPQVNRSDEADEKGAQVQKLKREREREREMIE